MALRVVCEFIGASAMAFGIGYAVGVYITLKDVKSIMDELK